MIIIKKDKEYWKKKLMKLSTREFLDLMRAFSEVGKDIQKAVEKGNGKK